MLQKWGFLTSATASVVILNSRRLYHRMREEHAGGATATKVAEEEPAPSLLLQHLHCTVPTVAKRYRDEGAHHLHPHIAGAGKKLHATRIPEKDPETAQEGEAIIDVFCSELDMGAPALRRWRAQLAKASHRRWNCEEGKESGEPTTAVHRVSGGEQKRAKPPTCEAPERVEARVSLTDLLLQPLSHASSSSSAVADASSGEVVGQSKGPLYFQPRAQDSAFVRSCLRDLRAVVSPLVTLSPPGAATAQGAASAHAASLRPSRHRDSSSFYATRFIPAGVFVLSVPTDAVLFAEPPSAADPILSYFMHLEDLVGQLVAIEGDGADLLAESERRPGATAALPPHYGYVQYLKESIVPARNLPFLTERDLEKLLAEGEEKAVGSAEGEDESPARQLWRFFHKEMNCEPLSAFLRERLSKEEYAWWVSAVLSRRAGAATLIPLVDKLNHSALPNCYYTMSSAQAFCCLDALDNMMAGVSAELLYQPFVHVHTVREVQPGEELTLCYSSAADGLYRPASGSEAPPTRPAFLDRRTPRPQRQPSASTAAFDDTLSDLFSPPTATTIRPPASERGRSGGIASLLHPGRQQVETAGGRARWQLQWGFVPAVDAVYSERDLREMAALAAEKRVDARRELFPL